MAARVGIGNRLIEQEQEAPKVPAAPKPAVANALELVNELARREAAAGRHGDAEHIASVIAGQAELKRAVAALGTSTTSPGLRQPDYVPREDRKYDWQFPQRRW
jgi:hypothetical protein